MHFLVQEVPTEPVRPTGLEAPERVLAPGEGCDPSEERVIRQLVEALLFERLVEFQLRPRTAWGDADDPRRSVYRFAVHFRLAGEDYSCVAALSAFGRLRLGEGSLRRTRGGSPQVDVPGLVRALGLDAASEARLEGELSQTVELCRWNRRHLQHHLAPRRALGFQDLESALVEGHPYHPCFKTRTGFSLEDHRAFGPEAGAEFQLEWLAISRSLTRVALPSEEGEFWQKELGDDRFADLMLRAKRCGAELQRYALFPIHPWQLRRLRPRLEAAIAAGEVIPLGACGDRYRATQSLRTLVNTTRPQKANVKLPLDVVCTSSRRNLQAHFACTAPLLSEWLDELVAADPYLKEGPRVVLLKEYAGMMFEPERAAPASAHGDPSVDLVGMVGAVYRESVLGKLAAGEAAVPFTALFAVEADGRPFIAAWLERHGTEVWVTRLIEVVLLPIWHLLVHHGVAFEAHAQNLVLLHQDGWPSRIVLRDFHEETEFVADFLARPELAPRFERVDPYFATIADDDGYRMASVESLRQLFMDTVYVFNFAELSFLLERYCGFEESRFWSRVRQHLLYYERSGLTDPKRIARIWVSDAQIAVESLLKKKLLGAGRLEFFEHQTENTVAR